jgi:tetratricopeptide (TPR) repeat protein
MLDFKGAQALSAGEFPDSVIGRFRDQSQLDFEIEFFERILTRHPNSVDVLRCQGELLTRKGLYTKGLQVDLRLAGLCPNDCVVRYNLACSFALTGQKRQAIDALRRAIEDGYDDLPYLEVDRDLESLRDEPEYRQLLKDFGAE